MKLSTLKKFISASVRVVLVFAACALMVFSYASPASAIGSDKSSPVEGEAPLNDIYQKSEDMLKMAPGEMDMEKLQSETERGLNGVQGSADIDKMHNPQNSRHATSAAEEATKALEKVTLKR